MTHTCPTCNQRCKPAKVIAPVSIASAKKSNKCLVCKSKLGHVEGCQFQAAMRESLLVTLQEWTALQAAGVNIHRNDWQLKVRRVVQLNPSVLTDLAA